MKKDRKEDDHKQLAKEKNEKYKNDESREILL